MDDIGLGPILMEEHRRVQRVTLMHPLVGMADGERVYVVDASLTGVRMLHARLFRPQATCSVAFSWDGKPIQLEGNIRWTKPRIGSDLSRSSYQSGVEIATIRPQAHFTLQELVESHIDRALDERKANARGIPPVAVQSVQSGRTSTYARHELITGGWRKTITGDPAQPTSGFTVSVKHSHHEVEMLRAAYVAADSSMRGVIQTMAQLSVANPDGIPTRKYNP
jgi:hypothetical protein